MITINGYQVNTKIYESSNSIVYRGIRDNDNQSVIIKVLKQDYPTESELTRYKQEYQLSHSLNFAGVIKAYELLKYQSTLIIIFEDFGGDSLTNWLSKCQFTLEEFLRLAIQITDSLGAIHGVDIIHKDINPSNIIYNPDTEEIKIIDFGISTQLLRETPTLKNPHVLEGTLAYISPEQTGRMNRCLDYRTDFYSLGVTFYELLTGKLPFETTEPMELVHCHLAKQPIPPHQQQSLTLTCPQIPQLLSDIVLKLMAKTAEERYQSAWGIKADLEECLKQLQTTGKIPPFPLGTQDISETFHIPQKLYGREQEVQMLLAAFERVAAIATSKAYEHRKSNFSSTPVQNLSNARSRTEMMLVSGYSGIGKSALVREIYKPVTRQRGYFISGKFDQFQRNIPYSAIVSAFSSLVQQLLSEPEEQLNQWREKLLAVLNPNGQVIIDVIPEVELIIGKQPTVATLPPIETQNRFNLVFHNFIKLFCSEEHPLVIFLDDLQWADTATLKLIELIMTNEETEYLLLIGAYRDNEVNATHPLMLTLDKLEELGATLEQITLAPLQENQINQLIADTLQAQGESVIPLAKLVVNKTAGNPFFVKHFLQTLYTENLLRFKAPQDGHQAQWQWDIYEIEAVGITDNVVELMVSKLKKLPVTTQKVLQLAACVGNYFNLTTLSIVYEKSLTDTFRDLLSAIQEGFVLPTSELKTSDQEIIESQLVILNFKFLHDRVQ
ncbi:serine/threonine-protein kinase PknK, partial [Moorena sp. SIO3H5]|uniref:ATP-binding protein n=1 Tax=Moorena sp. SIO3H5 TaxID=2607834 RepID=UPI0013BBEC78